MTGSPPAVFQPRRFQPAIHFVIESSIRRESVTMQARLPAGSARRPSIAAVNSMRLFVVSGGAAVQLDRRLSVRRHDDRGPAAGAGVAAAGAVGPHQRLPGTGLDRGLGEAGGAAAGGWHGARS